MSDTNCRHTVNLDWQRECENLNEELNKAHEQLEVAKAKNADMSLRHAFLEGQIRAFEFCVTKGGVENGKV